jgi:hypothetical protein
MIAVSAEGRPVPRRRRTTYAAPSCISCSAAVGARYGARDYMTRTYYRDGSRWIPFGWLCLRHDVVSVDAERRRQASTPGIPGVDATKRDRNVDATDNDNNQQRHADGAAPSL